MNGVDWIRLYTDFFDNPKIRQIKTRKKDGDTIICIWINLLCLAGKQNRCGVFMLTDSIPYTDEELANEIGRSKKEFLSAMQVLRHYEMIIDVDGVPAIKNWGVYQQQLDTLDKQREQNRLRVARYRERQKQVSKSQTVTHYDGVTKCVSNANVTLTEYSRVDNTIEESKKESKNLNKEIISYEQILDEFFVTGCYREAIFRFIKKYT